MSTNARLGAAFGLFLVVSILAWNLFAQEPSSACGRRFADVRANIVAGGPPKDGIPSIDSPKFSAAQQSRLPDDEWILGVSLPGLTAAFPHSILVWHEIVNLNLDGERLALTYCPLTRSGVGFRGLELGVSGRLYNSNLIAYDRATDSLLPQILGTFISGPLCGETPETFPVFACRWKDWRARHPETKVLSTDTGHARAYSGAAQRDPYDGYYDNGELFFPVTQRSDRLPLKAAVLCFSADGEHLAVARQGFDERHPDGLDRTLGETRLRLVWDAALQTVVAEEGPQGFEAFWFAWYATRPDTRIDQ